MKRLTIVVPALWSAGLAQFDPCQDLPLPALETLLGRARVIWQREQSAQDWLLECYQAQGSAIANWMRAYELPEVGEGHWLRADPAFMRVDRDRALLFDLSSCPPTPAEVEVLLTALNQLFAEDGLQFFAASPLHWYVRLPQPFLAHTTPLWKALGQDVRQCMPQGERALQWHRLLNEVQMLLHDQQINDQRELQGLPTINSIWLWGEGDVQKWPVKPATGCLWANEALAHGLANACQQTALRLPAQLELAALQDGDLIWLDQLVVPAARADITAWRETLLQLEREWFEPMLAAWRQGRVQCQLILPEAGLTLQLGSKQRWQFWRGRKRLIDFRQKRMATL